MNGAFPYSYVRCPCVDEPSLESTLKRSSQIVEQNVDSDDVDDAQDQTFEPHNPRASYELYPLDHLMWCEDCHEIRCPRCTIEEVVCWYCPTCLFECAGSMVRNEGTRCTRNCHNCPICTAPLATNSLDREAGGLAGPWILSCEYCSWTTLDVDIKFDKPNNIFGQLQKIYAGKPAVAATQSSRITAIDEDDVTDPDEPLKDHDLRFQALRKFYAYQLSKAGGPSNPMMSPSGDINYNSPSSLARIMSLYGAGSGAYGKRASKPIPIRPAIKPEEGILEVSRTDEISAIIKIRREGLEGTTDAEQRGNQSHSARFLDELRPVPVQLRTKRSRRCRTCRHILVRPETKITSTRYRIKLVAINYVPAMTLVPLNPPAATAAPSNMISPTTPTPTMSSSSSTAGIELNALPPSRPLQFLLTLKNPMFDAIKVTLATPATVPGTNSRVTILCPTFEVGAQGDVWEDALGSGDARRSSRMGLPPMKGPESESRVAEAGKVWEKGRNWTAVVVEVVCERMLKDADRTVDDEDILEIPIHVRLEYETDVAADDGAAAGAGVGVKERKREKRDLAYWCTLGVGKIARVDV